MWISALVIALAMAVVVMGGVKRISSVASMLVPPMVGIYLIATVVILIANAGQIPSVIAQVCILCIWFQRSSSGRRRWYRYPAGC